MLVLQHEALQERTLARQKAASEALRAAGKHLLAGYTPPSMRAATTKTTPNIAPLRAKQA